MEVQINLFVLYSYICLHMILNHSGVHLVAVVGIGIAVVVYIESGTGEDCIPLLEGRIGGDTGIEGCRDGGSKGPLTEG